MEFGPEIKVDGVRPGCLKEGDIWEWSRSDGIWHRALGAVSTYGWNGKEFTHIRLPADHPHYQQNTPTPDERAVAPELVARMIEHLKDCGQAHNIRPRDPDAQRRYDEMKAILAALEPVDPDKEIVDAMANAMFNNVILREVDLDEMRECAKHALQAYRQLKKEGK